MNSRMSKYDIDKNSVGSRTKKNKDLYNNINKSELDNFKIVSNTTILGENNKNEIDVEKIKKILDTKYNEPPKRKSIRLDSDEDTKELELEATKEYDINAILNRAKSEKITTYEEERAKKIRDTQFDILKNLNLENEKEEDESELPTSLESLINTIAINEKKVDVNQNNETMDLFSDLKAEEENKKVEMTSNVKEFMTTSVKPITEIKKEEEPVNKLSQTQSFFTKETKFKDKDFEKLDLDDKEDRNIFTEIIVVIILIAFVAGMVMFFNSIFNLF